MSGNFRHSRWDPTLICSQIVAIQSTFYITLGFNLLIVSNFVGYSPTIDQIFNFKIISFRTSMGLIISVSFLINSFIGSLILYSIIQRAKPCLDFTLTVFAIHFFLVWFYNGLFPSSFAWWILNVICVTIMCVFGEYLCLKTELKSIPLLVSHRASAL